MSKFTFSAPPAPRPGPVVRAPSPEQLRRRTACIEGMRTDPAAYASYAATGLLPSEIAAPAAETAPAVPLAQLTIRQYDIVLAMKQHLLQEGRTPSLREIGARTRNTSTSDVSYNVERLCDFGYVRRVAGTRATRGFVLTVAGLAVGA